jgi:hypothetical protein
MSICPLETEKFHLAMKCLKKSLIVLSMHFPAQPDQAMWLGKDAKEHRLDFRVLDHLINSYDSGK